MQTEMMSEQTEKKYKTAERCKQAPNPEPLENLQQGSFKAPVAKQRKTNDLQGPLTQTSHFMD